MTIQTIIGFDSAWTDTVPGAICSITLRDGHVIAFSSPELVDFADAAERIEHASAGADLTLVALDQPTLVPNFGSMRPVERVVASVVNALGGGVQPANRGRETMFGDTAPVWRFLDRIGARENPFAVRNASEGRFLIEVFPALALPSMIPDIWHRRKAAKYNPANRKTYLRADWDLVTGGVAAFAASLGIEPIVAAASDLERLQIPQKSDQDKLDALICLTVAVAWWQAPQWASMVIGDGLTGYMVTPVSPETRAILTASALHRGVPADEPWVEDASRDLRIAGSTPSSTRSARARIIRSRSAEPIRRDISDGSERRQCPECGHAFRGTGWGGIDAHWKTRHEHIMPYADAWPIIRAGGRPSEEPNCS